MGNRKFHTLPLDTWTCLWKEVHTAYKNNHYLSICIQKCKTTKFWWMLSYPSCSQEVSVKVISLILLLVILLVPLSCTTQPESLSPVPTFSRTPLKHHLLQIVSFQHVCVSVSTIKPPEFRSTLVSSSSCLTRVNLFMASLSSFMARFLVRLSWPPLVIVTAFWSLCTRYSLLIHYIFQWLFQHFGP